MTDTPSTFPKIHAAVGDRARCESGHSIAIFVHPVVGGEPFVPAHHLGSWSIGDAERESGRCACGAAWRVGVGIYARARIGSDWMPMLDSRIEEEAAKAGVGVAAE
jgi:hypothetical protein